MTSAGRRPHFLTPLLQRAADGLALYVEGRKAPVATTLEAAFDSTTRNRGLLGRDALAPDAAFVIAPSSAVHTFGMRFPIDLVFAARDGRVVKVRAAVPARRISVGLGAFAVIEMAAGAAERSAVRRGDRLVVRRPD
jgi:uncharacterized membrane protein (UPF0127 family)